MRTSFAASLFTLAVVLPTTLGNYFTGPTSSTVWSTSNGKTLTWKQQAGSPAVGTIQIRDAEGTMSQVLANSVSLLIESLAFPAGVKITSPSNSYIIEMVAATDTTYIIAAVGPFKINSFGTEPATPSPRVGNSPPPAPSTPAPSPAPAPAASPAPAPAPTTSAAPAPAVTTAVAASPIASSLSALPTSSAVSTSSRMVTIVSTASSANASRSSSTLSALPTAASARSGSEKLVVAIGFGIIGTVASLLL